MKKNLLFLKRTLMLSLIVLLSTQAFAQTASPPAAGDGSEGDPYQIATLDNLYWLTQNTAEWNKHYIQTANIDARTTKTWDSGAGFSPIGNITTYFNGRYNGKGHAIDSLYINRPESSHIGFFGYIREGTARVDSLGITNANITGNSSVGILAGMISYGGVIINSCYTTGSVAGSSFIGGLVGDISSGITKNCYSHANVSSDSFAGGFTGEGYNCTILNSYSTGTVSGGNYTGGFLGRNYSGTTATGCFWDTEASGRTSSAKGTGLTTVEMKNIANYINSGWDFMADDFNGSEDIWGRNNTDNNGYPFLSWQGYDHLCTAPISAVGKIIIGNVQTNSITLDSLAESGYGTTGYAIYINREDTWTVPSDGDQPTANTTWGNLGQQCIYFGSSSKPKVQITGLTEDTKYYFKVFTYNDCSGTETYEQTGTGLSKYTITSSVSVPSGDGSEGNPYLIANLENLAWLMYSDTAWNKHYIQTADINAADIGKWQNGLGFSPIGNPTINFTGSYNGKGHIIDSLFINRPETVRIGFFGEISPNGTKIDSLGITNANITGNSYTGILIGLIRDDGGIISSCYTTGIVTGYDYVGGLVGDIQSDTIKNCYSWANIKANSNAGGLVGYGDDCTITNSYSTGSVVGNSYIGGLLGRDFYYKATVSGSFWDVTSSGKTTSDGGKGLTTSEMKDLKTYLTAEWDYMDETYNGTVDAWGLNSSDNNGYPFLTWQGYTPDAISCQAPLSPAKNIYFENTTVSSIQLDSIEEAGYGTEGYVLYINIADTWASPINGSEPVTNTTWQNTGQQCIYFGTSNITNVTVTGLSVNTKYYFKVYAHNDCSGTKTYETGGFLDSIYTKVVNTAPSGIGTSENPYVIANLENLAWLAYTDTVWDKHFIQSADINATTTIEWEGNAGFSPIGLNFGFKGSYNGKGHIIDSLYINRSETDSVGFFGSIAIGSHIDSIGLTNASVTGKIFTGILGGYNQGNINNSFTSGNISVNGSSEVYSGGFVGYSKNAISNCYSTANISVPKGGSHVGGFIGRMYLQNAILTNCYSTGSVTSSGSNVGGFAGSMKSGRTIGCFWDTETSGLSISAGGTGKTTAEMNNKNTFFDAGWDFMNETTNGTDDVWGINCTDNSGYPFMQWQGFEQDTEVPVADVTNLAEISGQCSVTVTEAPTATDDCSGTITGTTNDPLEYNAQGRYTIKWTYDDGNGNISTQNQAIEVSDITNPVISCKPNQNRNILANESVYTVSGAEFNLALTSDNCSITSVRNNYNNTSSLNAATFPEGTTVVTWTVTDNAGNSAQCSFDVIVSKSTGINELEEMGIFIYPNPVSEILNFTCGEEQVQRIILFDIIGKPILEKTLLNKTEQINMSSYSAGVYFISIYTNDAVYTSRIIKK